MKKLTFLALLILPLIISSQNWQAVNPGQISFYSNDDSGLMDYTVMVDSVATASGHPIYYLNRSIKKCDTCTTPVPCYDISGEPYIRNVQGIFAKQIYDLEQGKYWFYDNVSFVLLTQSAPGDTWLYDTTANISAEVTETNQEEIFPGVIDSTKRIQLSNGKEIRLSKNYGILQFPSALDDVEYFHLAGLENESDTLGMTPPGFFEIFDIQLGDIFQYAGFQGDDSFPPPNSDHYTLKKKAVSVNKTENSVTIGWDYILRYLQSGTVQIFSNEESYFDEPEFMAVQNPGALYNFCADDQNYFGVCSEFNAIYSEINHRYTPHLSQVKSIGNYRKDNWWDMPQILVQCENESPLMVNVFDSYIYSLGRTYASGLGLVGSQVIEIYYFNRFDIEGYVKDGDTLGIITPDDVLLDINAISPEQVILIFPNPAKEKIVIRLPEKSKVQIFDSKGQIKFAEVFAEPESEIDLRNFVPGVYFVKFVSGRKSYTQKLIVE